METPTVNFMCIARRKSDSGWDAVVSGDLREHCSKMDDVRADGARDFLIKFGIQKQWRGRPWGFLPRLRSRRRTLFGVNF